MIRSTRRLRPRTSCRSGAAVRASNKIGLHLHDAGADKVSSLAPIPFFVAQIFQTGVDVWMPATTPPDGTISFLNEPRGDTTRPQVVNVPNWASSDHRIVVQFNDYVQDINSWNECKKTKPARARESPRGGVIGTARVGARDGCGGDDVTQPHRHGLRACRNGRGPLSTTRLCNTTLRRCGVPP